MPDHEKKLEEIAIYLKKKSIKYKLINKPKIKTKVKSDNFKSGDYPNIIKSSL